MNFSQFLVENPDIPSQIANKPQVQIKTELEKDSKPKEKKKETIKKNSTFKIFDTKSNSKSKTTEEHSYPYNSQEFKRGDFVIIQRLENSHLNAYKGYFGQIKEYRIIDDSAYVILEAMNNPTAIKFPVGHLVHRTKFF